MCTLCSYRLSTFQCGISQMYFFRWQGSGFLSVVLKRVYEQRRNESPTTSPIRIWSTLPFSEDPLAIFRLSGGCESFCKWICPQGSRCASFSGNISLRQQIHSRQTFCSLDLPVLFGKYCMSKVSLPSGSYGIMAHSQLHNPHHSLRTLDVTILFYVNNLVPTTMGLIVCVTGYHGLANIKAAGTCDLH